MDWQGKVQLRDTFSPEYKHGAELFRNGQPIEKCSNILSRAGWEEARDHKKLFDAFRQHIPAPRVPPLSDR